MDKKLQERQARETGICPIREELYSQAFDEIIRQVTINCAERGFLLVRVRDEIKMTIQAYQTLYESSIAYGMRKALQAEQARAEMQLRIAHIQDECLAKEEEVEDLRRRITQRLEDQENERRRAEFQHKEEIDNSTAKSQTLAKDLEKSLTTFTEAKNDD